MDNALTHPWFDEHTDECAVYDASALRVALSAPVRHFLGCAAAEGIRPVTLTEVNAALTTHLSLAMENAGAFWAVETDNQAFSAMSGYRLQAFSDLWRNPPTAGERLTGFDVRQISSCQIVTG